MSTHSNALPAAGRIDPERLRTAAPTVAGGRLVAMNRACRIAPEHLPLISKPFFATKPNGRGTGLGLSIAGDILRKHHGRRAVERPHGTGSTFRIILPVHTPETAGLAET